MSDRTDSRLWETTAAGNIRRGKRRIVQHQARTAPILHLTQQQTLAKQCYGKLPLLYIGYNKKDGINRLEHKQPDNSLLFLRLAGQTLSYGSHSNVALSRHSQHAPILFPHSNQHLYAFSSPGMHRISSSAPPASCSSCPSSATRSRTPTPWQPRSENHESAFSAVSTYAFAEFHADLVLAQHVRIDFLCHSQPVSSGNAETAQTSELARFDAASNQYGCMR